LAIDLDHTDRLTGALEACARVRVHRLDSENGAAIGVGETAEVGQR
jgi:hypothetical protein